MYHSLCSYYQDQEKIVFCVASSEIAVLLLLRGRTSDSRFHIPLQILDNSICNVLKQSALADLRWKTDLVIWDEVFMQRKHCFKAVDRCF